MTRINVYATGDEAYEREANGRSTLIGHFDRDGCTDSIQEGQRWDGNNMLGIISGLQLSREVLLRTKQGRWVLHHDARLEFNGPEYYRFMSDDQAKEWLLRADTTEAEAAIEKYFGEIEEESGPNVGGRPPVGPTINVAYPKELLDRIEAAAKLAGVSRAQWLRDLASEHA